jgi:hypothetical protein
MQSHAQFASAAGQWSLARSLEQGGFGAAANPLRVASTRHAETVDGAQLTHVLLPQAAVLMPQQGFARGDTHASVRMQRAAQCIECIMRGEV